MSNDAAVSYDQFRRYAQRFIAVLDRSQTLPTRSFLLEAGGALADLYSLALMLPDPKSVTSVRPELDVPGPQLDSVQQAIASRGGAPAADLTGHLAAVYRALKSGIVRMSHGVPASEILRHWRQTFVTEWGDHATAAMRAIYLVLRQDSLSPTGRSR